MPGQKPGIGVLEGRRVTHAPAAKLQLRRYRVSRYVLAPCRVISTTQSSSGRVAIAPLSSPGLGKFIATASRCRFRFAATVSNRSIRRNWRAPLHCGSFCRRSLEKKPTPTESSRPQENGAAKSDSRVWRYPGQTPKIATRRPRRDKVRHSFPDPLILASARLSYIRPRRTGKRWSAQRTRQETSVDFLTHHFSLLGLDLQWWMPIVTGGCAIYVTWLWLTGQFSR